MMKSDMIKLVTCLTALVLALVFSAPAGAYTLWKDAHEDHQTELWINPNCLDVSAGSPADQIRSVLGGAEAGGADAWAEQTSSGWLGFCFAGTTTLAEVDTADGINLVFWQETEGNGAVALTYCNSYTVDDGFDILLFDHDRTWAHDLQDGGTDIKGVMTHECGHALGLGHTGDHDSTMWPYIKGNGEANRLLSTDDGLGVRALYGFGSSGGDSCLFEGGASANDACDSAIDIFAGETVDGDTIWAVNDYDPGAGGCATTALPGPDAVYHLTLEQNEQLDAQVIPVTAGFDPAIYIFAGCGADPIDCLAGSDDAGAGGDETLSFLAPAAGDYYLVIDSAIAEGMGACGLFTLSTETGVGGPSTVLASLQCNTSSGTLPCGVNLKARIYNMTEESRRVAARIDLDAAGGHVFTNLRGGSVTIGAGMEFSRDLVFNLPAVGLLDGTNTFLLTVIDTTPGDPSPVAGDRSEDTCAVVTTLE